MVDQNQKCLFVIRQRFLLNIPTAREHVLCITCQWQTKPFSCHMHCYFQTFSTWCTHTVCRLVKIAVYLVEQSFNHSSYLFTVTYICCQNEDQSSSVTKSMYFYPKCDHKQLEGNLVKEKRKTLSKISNKLQNVSLDIRQLWKLQIQTVFRATFVSCLWSFGWIHQVNQIILHSSWREPSFSMCVKDWPYHLAVFPASWEQSITQLFLSEAQTLPVKVNNSSSIS